MPTAIVYAGLVLLAVSLRPAGLLVWALLAALAYLEFARLVGASAPGGTLLVLGFWALHATPFLTLPGPAPLFLMGLTVILLELPLGGLRGTPPRHRGGGGRPNWPRRALWTLGGALWIGGLLGYLVDLGLAGATGTGAATGWPVWLLLALALTWAADVAAYGAGSLWGRRPLAPRISPGKTWEGTLAGFAAAALVALIFAVVAGLPTVSTLIVAVMAGPAALTGDLVESALKRRVGVKDSGSLLPGHGGMLDRIDSLLGVAPVVAFALAVSARAV